MNEEHHPAAAAYLDALPDSLRAEASTRVREGKSDVAVDKLRLADPDTDMRLVSEAMEVLAGRLGAEMRCTRCFEQPANNRGDYPYGALCDRCSASTTAWTCCDCGEPTSGDRPLAGGPCTWCALKRTWDAYPQAVRDELRQEMADGRTIMVIKRIRQLTGCGLREAVEMAHLPHYRELD
ncbi:hypothetical protein LFM09_03055 [Lentzea alba]|uniref:hypothetical protein n=1 Tax=Lentzea alba TaxID=2714351 RepID=UPI0039BF8957